MADYDESSLSSTSDDTDENSVSSQDSYVHSTNAEGRARTALLELLHQGPRKRRQFDEPFVIRMVSNLLHQGAEVNVTDGNRRTCLHYDNTYKYGSVAEMLFRHGANVNAQDKWGMTPFYLACTGDHFTEKALHLLMSRKADPWIESEEGDIPLTAMTFEKRHLVDFVFDYTFGGRTNIIVKLSWLTKALPCNTPVFRKLCNKSYRVEWKSQDLHDLCDTIPDAYPDNLYWFLKVYEDVAVAMFNEIKSANPIGSLLSQIWVSFDGFFENRRKNAQYYHLIRIIFNSRLAPRFVQRLEIDREAVSYVIRVNTHSFIYEEPTDLVARMLQLGVHVTGVDLTRACRAIKYPDRWPELFHMIREAENEDLSGMVKAGLLSPEVILKHDVHVTSVKLLSYIRHNYYIGRFQAVSRRDVVQFLDYFCDQGLKQAVLRVYGAKDLAKVQERINQLPNVTSLIQLSRDVFRKTIIERFDIKTSQEFDSVLERFTIGDWTKKIIRFQMKLY